MATLLAAVHGRSASASLPPGAMGPAVFLAATPRAEIESAGFGAGLRRLTRVRFSQICRGRVICRHRLARAGGLAVRTVRGPCSPLLPNAEEPVAAASSADAQPVTEHLREPVQQPRFTRLDLNSSALGTRRRHRHFLEDSRRLGHIQAPDPLGGVALVALLAIGINRGLIIHYRLPRAPLDEDRIIIHTSGYRRRACSSVGRAPGLQPGGREFEPPQVHQQVLRRLAQRPFS